MINVYQPVQDPSTGSGHNISCSVMVPVGIDPSLVRIEWIKDSEVTNSTRISVINSYNASAVTKMVIFNQLRATDNGTYRCSVMVEGFNTTPSVAVILVNGGYNMFG